MDSSESKKTQFLMGPALEVSVKDMIVKQPVPWAVQVAESSFLLVAVLCPFLPGTRAPALLCEPFLAAFSASRDGFSSARYMAVNSWYLCGMCSTLSPLVGVLFGISSSDFRRGHRNLVVFVTFTSVRFFGLQVFGGVGVEWKRDGWAVSMSCSYRFIIILFIQWRMHSVCVGKDLKIRSDFLLDNSWFNRTFGAFGGVWVFFPPELLSKYLLTFSNCCPF